MPNSDSGETQWFESESFWTDYAPVLFDEERWSEAAGVAESVVRMAELTAGENIVRFNKAIVDAKLSTAPAEVQGRARAELWTRFNRHFKIAEYAQLPASRMAEARDYLIEMKMKTYPANAVIRDAEQEIETHCAAVRSLVAQIDDHMAEIFRIARRGCAATKAGTPRRSLAVNAFYTLEDAANAIGHSLAIMERMAKNIVPASGM